MLWGIITGSPHKGSSATGTLMVTAACDTCLAIVMSPEISMVAIIFPRVGGQEAKALLQKDP